MIFISQRKLQTIPQVSNRIYIQKKEQRSRFSALFLRYFVGENSVRPQFQSFFLKKNYSINSPKRPLAIATVSGHGRF